LNQDEFKTLQNSIGLDLDSKNTRPFLRLYGLIPTMEQHKTVKSLEEQGIPMVCIDQNPLALFMRYQMMDKSPGLFKLMRTHDMSLVNRINDFFQTWSDRKTEMSNCRNKIYALAEQKWDTVNRLGLN